MGCPKWECVREAGGELCLGDGEVTLTDNGMVEFSVDGRLGRSWPLNCIRELREAAESMLVCTSASASG